MSEPKRHKWIFLSAKREKAGHVSVKFYCENEGCDRKQVIKVDPTLDDDRVCGPSKPQKRKKSYTRDWE